MIRENPEFVIREFDVLFPRGPRRVARVINSRPTSLGRMGMGVRTGSGSDWVLPICTRSSYYLRKRFTSGSQNRSGSDRALNSGGSLMWNDTEIPLAVFFTFRT